MPSPFATLGEPQEHKAVLGLVRKGTYPNHLCDCVFSFLRLTAGEESMQAEIDAGKFLESATVHGNLYGGSLSKGIPQRSVNGGFQAVVQVLSGDRIHPPFFTSIEPLFYLNLTSF